MISLFFKALNRNRFKTFLIYLSITVAITAIFMITSISRGIIGMYSTMLKTEGDIIVTQAKIADTFFSDVNASLADTIKTIAGVKEVYAIILGASPINDLPIAAIYGVSENRFKTYALTQGSYPKKGEVMLGKNIDARLHSPKSVSISNKTFTVSGIFENGVGFEDGGAVLNREDASAIFNKEASILLVSIKRDTNVEKLIEHINALTPDIEAKTTHEFVDNYNQFKIIETSSNVISAVAFLMGLLGIASLISITINERRSEFGILRAIGKSSNFIMTMVVGETFIITCVGFLSALLFSKVLLFMIAHIEKFQGYVNGELSFETIATVFGFSLFMALLGALLPAYSASKIDPIILIQRGAL
ncbi:MAG TPA: ABC transporter permease [Sulfurospirillum cavolei]|uniref:ABC transporter permease n=1 Tax=Sulfurospirillum cavolei TaxID=366522 RepID=A0A2D3WCU8_9BACT|nr:MAG TPA: ABC transporter permease [Sulfurospirillum cavolei]